MIFKVLYSLGPGYLIVCTFSALKNSRRGSSLSPTKRKGFLCGSQVVESPPLGDNAFFLSFQQQVKTSFFRQAPNNYFLNLVCWILL